MFSNAITQLSHFSFNLHFLFGKILNTYIFRFY